MIHIATISQIASEAKVSSTLVSRVLNNKPGVSPENRARIKSIIEKHNYVPNAIARTLVTQKTSTIGVVMETLLNAFFFEIVKGVQDMAAEMEYNVVFGNGDNDLGLLMDYIDYFSQGRVDGVIAHYTRTTDHEKFFDIIKRASHYVLIEGDVPGKIINRVQINNFEGAYRATEHLIKRGCKNIVHFAGEMKWQCSHERADGFVRALMDHSIPTENVLIKADFLEEKSYKLMKRMISQNKIPDGCFAAADKAAFGILRAMHEHGLSAPDDIAVIGFDGDEPDTRSIVFPKLTTMRQPFYEVGCEAVRLLVRSIEDPKAIPVTTVFNAEFIKGDTA